MTIFKKFPLYSDFQYAIFRENAYIVLSLYLYIYCNTVKMTIISITCVLTLESELPALDLRLSAVSREIPLI